MLSSPGISWLAIAGLFLGGANSVAWRETSVRIALCNGGYVTIPINREQHRQRDDCASALCHGAAERRRKDAA